MLAPKTDAGLLSCLPGLEAQQRGPASASERSEARLGLAYFSTTPAARFRTGLDRPAARAISLSSRSPKAEFAGVGERLAARRV
jgi:hypothetical protein